MEFLESVIPQLIKWVGHCVFQKYCVLQREQKSTLLSDTATLDTNEDIKNKSLALNEKCLRINSGHMLYCS